MFWNCGRKCVAAGADGSEPASSLSARLCRICSMFTESGSVSLGAGKSSRFGLTLISLGAGLTPLSLAGVSSLGLSPPFASLKSGDGFLRNIDGSVLTLSRRAGGVSSVLGPLSSYTLACDALDGVEGVLECISDVPSVNALLIGLPNVVCRSGEAPACCAGVGGINSRGAGLILAALIVSCSAAKVPDEIPFALPIPPALGPALAFPSFFLNGVSGVMTASAGLASGLGTAILKSEFLRDRAPRPGTFIESALSILLGSGRVGL